MRNHISPPSKPGKLILSLLSDFYSVHRKENFNGFLPLIKKNANNDIPPTP